MSRRSRAVIEFVAGAAVLALFEQFRRHTEEDRPEWASPWTVAGAVAGFAFGWARDVDWRGVRTSRRRRAMFSAVQTLGRQVVVGDHKRAEREFGIGQLTGLVLYRFRYGVLGALPGDD